MTDAATQARERTVTTLRDVLRTDGPSQIGDLLAEDVRWYGFGPGGCHSRDSVLAMLNQYRAEGMRYQLTGLRLVEDRVLLHGKVGWPGQPGPQDQYQLLTLDADGQIVRMQDYATEDALQHDLMPAPGAGNPDTGAVSRLVPFVHVSDVAMSVAFYELLGFRVREDYRPDGHLTWAALSSNGAELMLAEASAPVEAAEQAVLFYLYSADLAGLRENLRAHGVGPGEIVDGTPGPRQEMRVSDPDGYCLMIAQVEN